MAKKVKQEQIPLMVLTNERTAFKGKMLMMIYQGAAMAQLAYMDGQDPDTGEIVPLLVGLEPEGTEGKFNVWPLAKIISKTEGFKRYLVPDGKGGYFDAGTDPEKEEGQAE